MTWGGDLAQRRKWLPGKLDKVLSSIPGTPPQKSSGVEYNVALEESLLLGRLRQEDCKLEASVGNSVILISN